MPQPNRLAEAGSMRAWLPISTAPTDGTRVLVWAAPTTAGWDDPAMHLAGFVTIAAYHPDAGWCVDELREVTHWQPVPEGPK